jgi:hypothetical protein
MYATPPHDVGWLSYGLVGSATINGCEFPGSETCLRARTKRTDERPQRIGPAVIQIAVFAFA